MRGKTYTVLAITIAFLLGCVLSVSAQREKTRKVAAFMLKFGYFNENNTDNNRGASDPNSPEFQASIRNLQRFGNIRVTGRMDTATINLINTDRCGVKDPQIERNAAIGRFNLQGSSWKKRDLTYRIVNYTKDGIPWYVQRRIFAKALSLWQSAAARISIRECSRCRDADILISFVQSVHGDAYPFDGAGGTLAHAFYPHNNQGLSGDAHFDDDEDFTTGTSNGINLDWVAVHEFGHSLGLQHSGVLGSIMYPWYQGYKENIQLTSDDEQGIQALYGPKTTVRPTVTPRSTRRPRVTPRSTRRPRVTPRSTRRPRVTPRSTRRPRVTPRSTRRPRVTPRPVPFLCNSSIRYDTVFVGPDSKWTYFFVGKKFWMVNKGLYREGPKLIKRWWKQIETPVDAAYLNMQKHIVFFTGSKFWEYDSGRKLVRYGHITQYRRGFPVEANMDAVFIWEGNDITYIFKGNEYWKYDERYNWSYAGYPKKIQTAWKFAGGVTAAVKWLNGHNYVFWQRQYAKMDKGKVGKARGYPQIIANRWMKCNAKGRDLFNPVP